MQGAADGRGKGRGEGGEDAKEAAYYARVAGALRAYRYEALREVSRRERHASRLSEAHKARLIPGMGAWKRDVERRAVEANAAFLEAVADSAWSPPAGAAAAAAPTATSAHMLSKAISTLHQCVRDWSAEGARERDECYGAILEELKARLPNTGACADKRCGRARRRIPRRAPPLTTAAVL